MILGFEIAITVLGIVMLVKGRGWGQAALPHPQYRWLGGFLLTLMPVVFIAAFTMGVVWAMTHPGVDADTIAQQVRWPVTGVEFGIAVLYAIIGTLWEKSIRRKIASSPTSTGRTDAEASHFGQRDAA